MLLGLSRYLVKGRSVALRFTYVFLYVYWIEHFYNIGSFIGIATKIKCFKLIIREYTITLES